MTAFDPRPLTDPVDGKAVRAWAREANLSAFSGTSVVGVVIGAIVAGIALLVFGSVALTFAASALAGGVGGAGALIAFAPVVIMVLVVVAVVTTLIVSRQRRRVRAYRLARFAHVNGMTYLPAFPNPGLPGMIFQVGRERRSTDLVRRPAPGFTEFANYRYTTGSGKNESTHRWGYVAVRLATPLPHIVLDATGNNGLFGASNLPMTLHRTQRLSLEGDFDRYFTLYCPEGYERDALYLFTPDIMARFIDNAAALDVEIVDDWLFFYAKRDFSTVDPATWAWLLSTVDAVRDKLAQWARWRDERLRADAAAAAAHGSADRALAGGAEATAPFTPGAPPASVPPAAPPLLRPPPGVAAPGRRLKKGVPWVTFVAVGVFVVVWLLTQSNVLGAFFGR